MQTEIPPLRSEVRPEQIGRIFTSIGATEEVLLWQAGGGQRRRIYSAWMSHLTMARGHLKFTPCKRHDFNFNSQNPIYFYEKKRIVIFKGQLLFNASHVLEVKSPDSLMIKEHRSKARVKFDPNHRMHVDVILRPRSVGSRQITKLVLDRSDNGLSFRVTNQELQLFSENERILVNCQKHQDSFIPAIIHYLTPWENEGGVPSVFWRVGVEFLPVT